jgi:hypothetical protein
MMDKNLTNEGVVSGNCINGDYNNIYSACAEYIAHLERLLIYKDEVIAEKESKIYGILETYKLHIDEKDRYIRRIISGSYQRNEIKISMLREKDRQIGNLIDEISSLRKKNDYLTDIIFPHENK